MSVPPIPTSTRQDLSRRIQLVLPTDWFPVQGASLDSQTPILDSILGGFSYAWQLCQSLLVFANNQTRITTATGNFLLLAAQDFFGVEFVRQATDTDEIFRAKVLANLLASKATRAALVEAIERFSGIKPWVQEPLQGEGLGGYGYGGYGVHGFSVGGSNKPFQTFVTCFATNKFSTRQSSATYIQADGTMSIAPMYLARQQHDETGSVSLMCEERGFNLFKDSLGWSGLDVSMVKNATITLKADVLPLLSVADVLGISVIVEGIFISPGIIAAIDDTCVTASAWIKFSFHDFVSISLKTTDITGLVNEKVIGSDQAGKWQRVNLTIQNFVQPRRTIRLDIEGIAAFAGAKFYTTCWQIEVGKTMTSFIPTSGYIGVRQRDQILQYGQNSDVITDTNSRNDIVKRVMPAGTIVWTRDIQSS